jgi:hypothetical protein
MEVKLDTGFLVSTLMAFIKIVNFTRKAHAYVTKEAEERWSLNIPKPWIQLTHPLTMEHVSTEVLMCPHCGILFSISTK